MTTDLEFDNDLRKALNRDGFVRIPQILVGDELSKYRAAASRTTQLARRGKWPFVRTLPKQFPPWDQDSTHGIWGVQHLLHPDLPDSKIFAESYFNHAILESITQLLQCRRDELVLELYNMLIRPDKDFTLRWHRDDIPPDVSCEEELRRLQEPMIHAQWNLALYPDSSLIVVPGSHKRVRTDMERDTEPYDDMPGQRIVQLEAGDVLFYDNNILHRGVYDSSIERMTLHGSMGFAGNDQSRARNILQHGIGSWAADIKFSCLPIETVELAERMRKRLIDLGSGENVGYSLRD